MDQSYLTGLNVDLTKLEKVWSSVLNTHNSATHMTAQRTQRTAGKKPNILLERIFPDYHTSKKKSSRLSFVSVFICSFHCLMPYH